jgi:hypothetical protein
LVLSEADLNEENFINTLDSEPTAATTVNNGPTVNNEKVFLNPSAQDTLLSNLMKNNFTVKSLSKDIDKNQNDSKIVDTISPSSPTPVTNTNMALATRDTNLCDVIKR